VERSGSIFGLGFQCGATLSSVGKVRRSFLIDMEERKGESELIWIQKSSVASDETR